VKQCQEAAQAVHYSPSKNEMLMINWDVPKRVLLDKAHLPGHLNFNLYVNINADINVISPPFLIYQS